MDPHLLGPLMFLAVFVCIFVGYPVAFSLGGVALVFAGIGIAFDLITPAFLGNFTPRVFGFMENQVLLAVPFFVFMGTMLQRSRLAEDLLRTIGMLFGPLPGGLPLAVVFVGTLLAAATGVVGASVVAMGMISLPIMLRYGTSQELATGVICASGTLGQIVPPSIVLVVLGDQLGVDVGDLFLGALIPGLCLAAMFALYVIALSCVRPGCAPPIPKEERPSDLGRLALRVLIVLVPPLVLILAVLGSIFLGVASPTEAGAIGAVGAMLLALVYRRFSLAALRDTMSETLHLTAMVMMLLIGSSLFTLVFRGLGGDLWIEDLLTNLPGGRVGFLVVANLAIFVLGFFIDFFEIAFILLPLFVPAARELGFSDHEMVWFGVLIGMNMQTSFLTPPFGFSLFYLRGCAPSSVSTAAIYRGAVPFIAIQLVGVALVACFPQLVTRWLD